VALRELWEVRGGVAGIALTYRYSSELFLWLFLVQEYCMDSIISKIAIEYNDLLKEVYGDDLAELVLFGSYARGDQYGESDVDLAVVFRDRHPQTFEDKVHTSRLASQLSLKYGLLLAPLTTSLHKKQTSMQGVYKEISIEGITV
jgi:predicted nucleotidyltransferase